ncbi:MAG: hypothetical protein ACAH95_03870 [Fimbriimonas sp.]
MWIFQNEAFLSIVAERGSTGRLLVRSRVEGDIQRALPHAEVFEDLSADYRYRAFVSKEDLKAALSKAVDDIDYDNFKKSVPDHQRHKAYMKVWQAMFSAYRR